MQNRKQKIFLGVLLAVSFCFFLFQLGLQPLYDYDEAHYARVVQETLQSGDPLTLKRFDKEWFEKPPLLLWLTMGSVKLLGENEFSMRLPVALFGVLAIWGTYLLTYFLTKNYWAALGAGFILLFSGIFPASGKQLRMDVPLATAIVFAIYSFVRGWEKPKWYLGFWAWIAIGTLLKSAPALFPDPIALIFSIIYRRWDWLKSIYFWLGVPLFLALAAPWHAYESLKFGSRFWNDYLGYHILQRFSQKVLGGDVTNWDYLKHLLFLNEPWFFLLLPFLALLVFYRAKQATGFRLAWASILSGLFIFLVFAVAKTKLMFYLVPIFPFEAIFVAAAALFIYRVWGGKLKKEIFVVAGSLLFSMALVSTSLQLFYFRNPYSYSFADEEREIGKLVREYDRGYKVYSLDWKNYETIYYYSGKNRIELVEKEQLKTGFPPPYFLIMPRPYLKNKDQPGVTVRYEGNFLVLLEASKLKGD